MLLFGLYFILEYNRYDWRIIIHRRICSYIFHVQRGMCNLVYKSNLVFIHRKYAFV